jgi:hypothetical protein
MSNMDVRSKQRCGLQPQQLECLNQIGHVRSYSVYKHDVTLKMAFGAKTMFTLFLKWAPYQGMVSL